MGIGTKSYCNDFECEKLNHFHFYADTHAGKLRRKVTLFFTKSRNLGPTKIKVGSFTLLLTDLRFSDIKPINLLHDMNFKYCLI